VRAAPSRQSCSIWPMTPVSAAKCYFLPLFIEELTKTVLESGFLKEAGDHFVLSGATIRCAMVQVHGAPVSPLRVMIDSNIVGALFNDPDTVVIVTRLQRSGAIRLLITHHQGDQLARASHHIRRTLQLLNPAIAVTTGAIWNVWGDHSSYSDMATEERSVDGGNERSFKHWAKFMIALSAVSRVDVFVTNDRNLRNAAKQEVEKGRLKLQVWNYEEFLKQLKILDVSRS
jgi:hypothetical protein